MRALRYRLSWLSAVTFLGVCTLLEAQERPQPQEEKIQVRVDRVNVGIVVTDAQGRFVSDLRREQFHVLDNGVEQPVVALAAIEEPAQVLLLIEAGPAVYMLESSHVWAANALLEGLSAGDRVAVVKYADAPTGVLDFTADKQAVTNALDGLRFNLGFASLNLSASISKVLERLVRVEGKKSVVLLSTGVDTSSQSDIAAAIQKLGVEDVRLFAVSLAGGLRNEPAKTKKKAPAPPPSNIDSELEEASRFLKQLAEASGGRAFFPSSPAEFANAYSQIAELVRHEYNLAYALPVQDGQAHKIDVRVDGPSGGSGSASSAGYRLDHRRAYLAPPAQ